MGDYRHLPATALQYSVNRVALPHKYPIGADHILIHVLTRRVVPSGGRPVDVGVAMIDAASCFAAYRWVVCEQRLGGRVVSLAGPRAPEPGNRFVPFGADCRDLLHPAGEPLFLGGPMTALLAPPGTVTGPDCDAVLALDPTPRGPAAPCIRCGWCRDHCPARLNVAALNDTYELTHLEQADRLGALSCVGCGVCSYVCPARLPLTERVAELKHAIRKTHQAMPLFAAPDGTKPRDFSA
jgi:electron transport complex protein RnfC